MRQKSNKKMSTRQRAQSADSLEKKLERISKNIRTPGKRIFFWQFIFEFYLYL